ncbi:hypothetical protein [Leptolyngbya sp. FACHB-321]|nr:hypothetical protein [Leptolyngbya sp. FACHB-321]
MTHDRWSAVNLTYKLKGCWTSWFRQRFSPTIVAPNSSAFSLRSY